MNQLIAMSGEMTMGEPGYQQAFFTTKGSLRVVELFTSE